MKISSSMPSNPILQNHLLLSHHLLLDTHALLNRPGCPGALHVSTGVDRPSASDPDKGLSIDLYA